MKRNFLAAGPGSGAGGGTQCLRGRTGRVGLKGAAVARGSQGGVAGRHGQCAVLGGAGCVIGHHEASKHAREQATQNQGSGTSATGNRWARRYRPLAAEGGVDADGAWSAARLDSPPTSRTLRRRTAICSGTRPQVRRAISFSRFHADIGERAGDFRQWPAGPGSPGQIPRRPSSCNDSGGAGRDAVEGRLAAWRGVAGFLDAYFEAARGSRFCPADRADAVGCAFLYARKGAL